jgi:hypothetical protein
MRSSTSVRVDVDIDFDDIIGDIPTEMLMKELLTRQDYDKPPSVFYNYVGDLIEAFRARDISHLRVVLDRINPGMGSMI